jgi:hypothetical protein
VGADTPSMSSRSSDETNRRRMLAVMGAGGAAALATLVSSKEAQAGHDGTNTFHLGEGNTVATGKVTHLRGDVGHFAFDVENLNTVEGGGLHSRTRGGLSAVHGSALDTSSPGVMGSNDLTTGGVGSGPGPGVLGLSGGGPGVRGHSDSGVGGAFSSKSGKAIQADGIVDIFADFAGREVVIIESNHAGEGALSAKARAGGIGVEGAAFPTEEELEFEDQKAGYGVRGIAMSAEGGYGEGPGVGVHGQSGSGTGVLGISESGTAVEARSGVEGNGSGNALLVHGKSAFSTAGSAVVPAGKNSVFVANSAVTEQSHISVTFTSDPGSRSVAWVERDPGNGFTLHMSSAPPSRRLETSFTHFALEPA